MKSNSKSANYKTDTGDRFYDKSAKLAAQVDPEKKNYNGYQTSIKASEKLGNLSGSIRSWLCGEYEGWNDDPVRKVHDLKVATALMYLVCVDNNIEVQPTKTLVSKLKEDIYYITEREPELAGEVLKYFEEA